MTVKEAMTKVSEERETFPDGWSTDLKEVYAKSGKALYEKKQKWVWMLTVGTSYNGEGDTVTLWRDKAKALAAMEDDIRETLAHLGAAADGLVRDGDEHAHLDNRAEWSVAEAELHA